MRTLRGLGLDATLTAALENQFAAFSKAGGCDGFSNLADIYRRLAAKTDKSAAKRQVAAEMADIAGSRYIACMSGSAPQASTPVAIPTTPSIFDTIASTLLPGLAPATPAASPAVSPVAASNTGTYLLYGVVGVAILGGIAWFMMRRRTSAPAPRYVASLPRRPYVSRKRKLAKSGKRRAYRKGRPK
jgi:hypothetical protein